MKIFYQLSKSNILIFYIIIFSNCSIFQFKSHNSFSNWYFGKPGMENAFKGKYFENKDCYDQSERRHPYYLHFRIFEVIFNPQGGAKYPDYLTKCNPEANSQEKIDDIHMGFNIGDAGLIDALISYRYVSYINSRSDSSAIHYILIPFVSIASVGLNLLSDIVRIPLYVLHDVIKLVAVPFAGIYYAVKDNSS